MWCRLPYPSNSVQLLPRLLEVYEGGPHTVAGQLSLSHSCPPENNKGENWSLSFTEICECLEIAVIFLVCELNFLNFHNTKLD